jgi:hypothetical protein
VTSSRAAARGRHRCHRAWPEELVVGVDHHHVALAAEGGAVGFQAAVELRKLRVAAEGIGIQGRGLGVALALDLLRVAVGFGDDHLALAVGVGADLLAFGAPLRAQFVGHLLALGLHAPVDRVGDVGHEVHALDAHVDDLDAERLGFVGQAAAHVLHDLFALGGQHALHVAR